MDKPLPPFGWPLLPVPDENGRLAFPTLAESVRQTIEVILRTRPGEQLMRPQFGGGLENLLTAPNTLETRKRVHDAVAEALARWEPRAVIDRVDVAGVAGEPTHLRVEIAYRLRRTGAAQQIGLTMRLEA